MERALYRYLAWLCLLVLALAVIRAVSCGPLESAPAPLAKRRPPEPVAGRWLMTWGGCEYAVTLEGSGLYEARAGSSCWVGYWRWCGHTRTLRIDERYERTGGSYLTYEVPLDAGMEGRANGVAPVRLRRAE